MARRAILHRTGDNPRRLLAVIMIASAALSTFMSNTATTAFFVPLTIGLARQARISVSKLLMPLAFSSILASSVTLVSPSTNIVISGLMTRYDMRPMGMFELTLVGIPSCPSARFKPAHVCHYDRGGGQLLLSDAAGAFLSDGLWAGALPVCGFSKFLMISAG